MFIPNMDIFGSCRIGNLENVKYWVEQKQVDVNTEDSWNATPLYYACLYGYYEVVEYLLVNCGAKCDLKTFQGERCYYAALGQNIRNLLVNEKVLEEGLMNSSHFYSFCKQVLHSRENSDFRFVNKRDEEFFVHRFFLTLRGASFFLKVTEGPTLNEDSILVELVLEYLYTARIIFPSKILENLSRFAANYKLDHLCIELANCNSSHQSSAKHSKLKIDSAEGKWILKTQLCSLLQKGMPEEFQVPFTESCDALMNMSTRCCNHIYLDAFTGFDICLIAEKQKFYAHKIMLINRSEYFATFIRDTFYGREMDGDFQILRFGDISGPALACILYYVYTDEATSILNIQNSFEVLNYANMWLLPGLVKQCANFMSDRITENNVISFIKISRLYNLYRLESTCVRYITKNLELIIQDAGFRDLVVADANEVSNREVTDSIPVIDDILGELRKEEYDANSNEIEVKEKRKLIESLLLDLNFKIVAIDRDFE